MDTPFKKHCNTHFATIMAKAHAEENQTQGMVDAAIKGTWIYAIREARKVADEVYHAPRGANTSSIEAVLEALDKLLETN
jgi:hypothetical protein